jgi:phosphoribosylformylglycinamidine (FGAM) synthase-like enzyme
MITAIAEMAILGKKGVRIDADLGDIRPDKFMFNEASGYIIEVSEENIEEFKKFAEDCQINPISVGKTGGKNITFNDKLDLSLKEAENIWRNSFSEVLK